MITPGSSDDNIPYKDTDKNNMIRGRGISCYIGGIRSGYQIRKREAIKGFLGS
jgi:hypothetical protein